MQIITNQFQKELKKHGSDIFPFLLSYERLSKYESGSFMWHWHPELEITLVTKGSMVYKVNNSTFHLNEGGILFLNSNVLHSGYMEQIQDCEYISITFAPKLIYGFNKSIVCQKYVEPLTQDFSLLSIFLDEAQQWYQPFYEILKRIISLSNEKPTFYELDIITELQNVWKLVFINYRPSTTSKSYEKRDYERIRKILDFLEHNYMNRISLIDISDHIHLSPSECSRLFKRYMNLHLFSFLNEYRIERSLEYLVNSDYTITDIAANVGFSDSNYYSKVFSKIKGCSPNMYRKRIIN